jgi:hypothetical protein
LYEPAEVGAVVVYVYDPTDPVELVVTETTLLLHPNTNTTVSPPTPTPFAVNIPDTVKVPGDGYEAEAVSEVETGLGSEPVLRFNVIFPGPLNVTIVGSFEPEQVSP